MKQTLNITILLLAFLICKGNVYSQTNTYHKHILNSFKLKIDPSKDYITSDNIKHVLHEQLNIPSDFEFRAYNIKKYKTLIDENDELGFTHEHLIQYYKGIKVEFSDIRVHYKNGSVVSVNGEYANEMDIDILPIFDNDYAIIKALNFVEAKK